MRNRFDRQLAELNLELTDMGKLCVLAIHKATDALKNGDINTAREIIEADAEIDRAERDIERLCMKLLLEQQPVAKDLRQISAALKMITDMERIGDQTSDIAEIIISAGISEGADFPIINSMSEEASQMVTDSISAYVKRNLELAGRVEANDDVVDGMFDEIKLKLINSITCGSTDNAVASRAIDLIMIAKYLERIADHATNIAEWVSFSITGVHEGGIDTKPLI